ncbi:UNKNOWN [Stylonychia lemnae]|uniref:Uncharacterized protein n=1 Tax=Stylonychia lemnae TaxID=5949 RepID=A0A078ALF3_STYLE|nr:UNKNOWN [Stylonychia lemnae]|eukprot:CDW82237.1 UNKNOWN [Stylonychia lemnae]
MNSSVVQFPIQNLFKQIEITGFGNGQGVGNGGPAAESQKIISTVGLTHNDHHQELIDITKRAKTTTGGMRKDQLLQKKFSLFKTGDLPNLSSADKKLSSRFLEQWINDTLDECYHLGIPGIIARPEHKLPLSRHGLDRITLTNMGIPNESVNRIYRSLFVFSVGFYELMTECTKYLDVNRVTVQSQIWKVFQVLLEYCCKTDYQLITQQMEKNHQGEVEDIENKYREVIQKLENSESELKKEMRRLQLRIDELEFERGHQDKERDRMVAESQKNQQKHEEEVQLRLHFESKLNTMHHVNREITNKLKQIKLKIAEEQIRNKDLQARLNNLIDENIRNKSAKEKLEKLSQSQLDQIEIITNDRLELEHKLKLSNEELRNTLNTLAKAKEQNEDLEKQKNVTDMDLSILQDFMSSKASEHNNAQNYLEALNIKLKDYETQIEQLKMREDRTRTKLRYFKSEHTGFELSKRQFQEREKENRQKIKDLEENIKNLLDKLDNNRVNYEAQIKKYNLLQNEHDDVIEKYSIQTCVKKEIEEQLKSQLDQTKKLYSLQENENNLIRQLTRDLYNKEMKLKEVEDERNDLDNSYQKLETQYENFKLKYETNSQNLKSQFENEKDSRSIWKDRYEKELQQSAFHNKSNLALKSEIYDLRQKLIKFEIQIERLTSEKVDYQEQSEDYKEKVQLLGHRNEKLERDIYIKKVIIDEYDVKKKNEIQQYKNQMKTLQTLIARHEMQSEDLSSDITRMHNKYLSTLAEIENLLEQKKIQENQHHQTKNQLLELAKDKQILQSHFDLTVLQLEETNAKYESEMFKCISYQQDLDKQKSVVEECKDKIIHLEIMIDQKQQSIQDIVEERDQLMRQVTQAGRIDIGLNAVPITFHVATQSDQHSINANSHGGQHHHGQDRVSGHRMSIYQQSNNLNLAEKLKTFIKEDVENSYLQANEQSKKMKPIFQKNQSIRKNNKKDQDFILEEDLMQTLSDSEKRIKKSIEKSEISNSALRASTNNKKRVNTSQKLSRNKGFDFQKQANSLRQGNLISSGIEPYNDASTSAGYNNPANLNSSVGFAHTNSTNLNISARVGTSDSKPSNQSLQDLSFQCFNFSSENLSVHRKKYSVEESMNSAAQSRIKRLLKQAYSVRD